MKKNAGRLSKKLFAAMMAGTMMTAMIGANVYATGSGSTANTPQTDEGNALMLSITTALLSLSAMAALFVARRRSRQE